MDLLAVDGAGINLFPVNLVEALKNRKVQIGIAAVAVLLAVALTLVWVLQPKNDNPQAGATASSSETANGTAVTSPEASSPPANPGACVTPDAAGFVPVRYSIESINVDDKVISGGREEDGAIAAPPKDEPRTALWWNEGPKVASNAGQVVLTIHTYQTGDAVGNMLYSDNGGLLKEGAVLKLYAEDGRVACYQYTESQKLAVSEYNPESDVLERHEGDPGLAIVICWDHNKSTNDWDSRIFIKFKPVTDAA